MTTKTTLGSTIVAILAIGVLGSLGSGINNSDINNASTHNVNMPFMAFAEKPVQEIVDITVNVTETEYAENSTFLLESVECKISTKAGDTTVNWCKATAIQNSTAFGELFPNGTSILEDFTLFFQALFEAIETGERIESIIVGYHVETLKSEIDPILEDEYPGIIIPEEWEEMAVSTEFSLTSDEPNDPIEQTKAVVEIEY